MMDKATIDQLYDIIGKLRSEDELAGHPAQIFWARRAIYNQLLDLLNGYRYEH